MNYIRSILAAMLTLVGVMSCTGLESPSFVKGGGILPKLENIHAETTESRATMSASVSDSDAAAECGFYWGITSATNKVVAPIGEDGRFTFELDGLSAETTYCYCAYVNNGVSEVLSVASTFTTDAIAEPEELDKPSNPDDSSDHDDPEQQEETDEPSDPDDPEQQEQTDEPGQPENPGEPEGPVEPEPVTPVEPSVNITIPDAYFKAWMVWHFDMDGDGEINEMEASGIHTIEIKAEEISSFEGIGYCPNLTKLSIGGDERTGGSLHHIDLSRNTGLEYLDIINNSLDTIDLSNNPCLLEVGFFNSGLTSIDLSHNPDIELLGMGYCCLSSIDLSANTKLKEVHLDNNKLTSINLGTSNNSIEYLDCSYNLLSELDISGCRKLNNLDCSNNPYLKTLYLKKGQVLGNITHDEGLKVVYKD